MEIKTKLNIDNGVWIIYENKVVKTKITFCRIDINHNIEFKKVIQYFLKDIGWYDESELGKTYFLTKEELIASL